MRSARHVLVALAAAAVLVLAGVGLWQAGQDRPRTLEQRTDAIAAELGCPTCQAQSVAMSRSEIASAMRTEISAQLAAGRTPEQIRSWFVDRYGPSVLLEPPWTGVGLVVWLVPAALLGAGMVLTVVVVRRRTAARRVPAPARRVVPALALAVVAAGAGTWLFLGGAEAERPSGPEAWVAQGTALEAEQAYAQAAEAYRTAAELRPQDVRSQVRLGLVLLKAGEPAEAEAVARQLLADHPAHPEGLLVLGLAQRSRHLPEAPGTLQRFLDTAPTHPAAGEVRRLLASS